MKNLGGKNWCGTAGLGTCRYAEVFHVASECSLPITSFCVVGVARYKILLIRKNLRLFVHQICRLSQTLNAASLPWMKM